MIKEFSSIKIDFSNNAFQILNGTEGKYSLSEIERCVVLNEKARKQAPFLALMPSSGLPTGILSTPYLFVGIKIIMKDNRNLAVYVSKNKTQVGTEQYQKDNDEAKQIVKYLKSRINT